MKTFASVLLTLALLVSVGCAGSTTSSTSSSFPARIAANDHVEPPTDYSGRIAGDVYGDITAEFKLCIQPDGSVSDVELVRSSGIASYDAKLQQHVEGFRYEPYAAAGVDSELCKKVSLEYRSL